jgi:multiple antibiotic resistance protein
MEQFSFVFTIFFMLLGPIKIIPLFAGLTQGADKKFKKDLAVRSAVIASMLCAFVALVGEILIVKYRISIDAVRIAGGLVLMIAALNVIFSKAHSPSPSAGTHTAIQLAASPVATPGIVPPAGIAAILLFMICAPQYPGTEQAVAICLGIVMVLNFLVMYFIDQVMETPGLMIILTVLGSVLLFVQVCLALQMILNAFMSLGIINV